MAHEVNQGELDIAAQVRLALIQSIGEDRLELWIPADTAWRILDNGMALTFTSDFACQLCRKMLRGDLARALEAATGATGQEIRFEVGTGNGMINSVIRTQEQAGDKQVLPTSSRPISPPALAVASNNRVADSSSHGSEPAQTLWQTFIAGDSNQLAWTAAGMVASEPGKMTPVFIHGPSGTGKSLILSALAQRMRCELRMRRVVHITSEQFTNEFTEGLQRGGLPMFRRKYRDVDAFLIDDIHFLVGKKSTLAEVRHTLDNLIRHGKQVVLTADRSLSELNMMGDEFTGRIRGGLIAPLFPLDEAIRYRLLKLLVTGANIQVDDDVLKQLSVQAAGDGRLLRGLVHRLTAVASFCGGRLTWDQCWSAVMDLVQSARPVVRLTDIERAICGIFGLEADSLQSKSRIRSVSQPRMLAMYLARRLTPAAYKEIGDYFGSRRHSTVISAEKTVASWLDQNQPVEGTRHLSVRDAIRHVEAQLQVG